MLNPDGRLWVDRLAGGLEDTGQRMSPADGERIVRLVAHPVAAGDTVRWIVGDTESGAGPTKKIHILVKPTRPDRTTNLVINTDRRTYLMELRSTEKTYMASVSWQYPEDQLIAPPSERFGRSGAARCHRDRHFPS